MNYSLPPCGHALTLDQIAVECRRYAGILGVRRAWLILYRERRVILRNARDRARRLGSLCASAPR